jgi:PAS domain S-box-containing protein
MQKIRRRVLIVEDVPLDAEMMLFELEQSGVHTESRRVSDKAALIDAMHTFVPDVILSDFSLPNFDGMSALKLRQQYCPDTPFIIVSGSLGEERAVQILKAGATDYVLKHDLTRLATAVERALADGDAQRNAKRISRELETERRLLSAVLTNSAALIALFDAEDRLVRVNPAASAACGMSEAQAIGRSYADLFAEPGQAQLARAAFRQIISRHGESDASCAPWREVTRLGRVILWSASFLDEPGSAGETIVLAGIDITEQQQQEEMCVRLAAIVDSSDDAIISKTLDDVVTSWNGGAERLFGYSADEAIGQPMLMLVPPGQGDEEAQMLQRLGKGQPVTHFQTLRRRKDGQEVSLSISMSPMRDAAGRTIGASLIARDISQQKRLEELRLRSFELEAENTRVQEANRLKSEFLANMSHELRTPLNAIIGFADLLYHDQVPPTAPMHKEFLGHIRTSGQHLLELINDILDLSKVEAGKLEFFPEPVDLARTVDEVTSVLHRVAAGKQIAVTVEIERGLGELVLDPARLKQVLYNYLSNALKFTPFGGRVTVLARSEGSDKFRLEVADTGIGISASDCRRLFREFEQLDAGTGKAHAGTGLGLALTKRLAEAQGGTVGVQSTPGVGSVFHAVLPKLAPAKARPPRHRLAQGPHAEMPSTHAVDYEAKQARR